MKAIVVYDSVFGNTEKIAEAMAQAVGASLLKATDMSPSDLDGAQWLIVGAPTRAFRPTPAIMAWLKKLPAKSLKGVRAAAFDTRASVETVDSPMVKKLMKRFGYAAEKIQKELKRKGADIQSEPEGFYVLESEGPLKDGETQRASEWVKNEVK
jgi:flavodoxin